MGFEIGQHVRVAALGKGVVREVRNGARYLVDVQGRSVVVVEAQLTLVIEPKVRKKVAAEHRSPAAVANELVRPGAPSSLDLHGMTVDEAIAALDEFLSEAILSGHAEVRIIHGRSGGRLRDAVHRRVKLLPSIRAFRLDPSNPGVTIVTL